jgi:hypothetical protein
MFRSFMEIFFISVQQIRQGVVPDGADKGVGVDTNIGQIPTGAKRVSLCVGSTSFYDFSVGATG